MSLTLTWCLFLAGRKDHGRIWSFKQMLNNPPEDAPRKPGIFPKTLHRKPISLSADNPASRIGDFIWRRCNIEVKDSAAKCIYPGFFTSMCCRWRRREEEAKEEEKERRCHGTGARRGSQRAGDGSGGGWAKERFWPGGHRRSQDTKQTVREEKTAVTYGGGIGERCTIEDKKNQRKWRWGEGERRSTE